LRDVSVVRVVVERAGKRAATACERVELVDEREDRGEWET
jgi:hypothetical protein